ncbi:MAG TPA: hypothetical protein VNA25_20815 [Phycisphaerae bacterium]|nr:hypothetical protein [Phycisphaerae bacterium]
MAHQPAKNLLTVLGLVQWGDLGPLTLYKNKRGRLVAFHKTWPTGPASPDQKIYRDQFRAAAVAWKALTPAKRQQWELASQRASLAMCGYALFVHHQMANDDHAIQAIQRQTRTDLIPA